MSEPSKPSKSSMTRSAVGIVERVVEAQVGPCRIMTLPYGRTGIVSLAGSFASYPDAAAGEDQVQDLVNAMLDKGTRARDQFEIAVALESVGAERSYYGGVVRSRFSGRCLNTAVSELVATVSEELRTPGFHDRQFELLKTRSRARLRQSFQRTGMIAANALARHWFDIAHPNYAREIGNDISLLDDASIELIRSHHTAHFGSDDMVLVVVGDVKPVDVERLVDELFFDWAEVGSAGDFETEGRSAPRLRREYIYVADKPSVDVAMGHAVPLRRRDADFLPLLLGNFVFGGNFSSRLMQVIRDEKGLTYGIRSNLSGVSVHYSMLWSISVTLGAATLEAGIEAVIDQLRRLVAGGITQAELDRAKETIVGAYLVRQDTTGNLAHTMLLNHERGFPLSQLADYPKQIESVTLRQVNGALKRYLKPESLSIAAAGSVNGLPT